MNCPATDWIETLDSDLKWDPDDEDEEDDDE